MITKECGGVDMIPLFFTKGLGFEPCEWRNSWWRALLPLVGPKGMIWVSGIRLFSLATGSAEPNSFSPNPVFA